MKNLSVLTLFTENYRYNYKKECVQYLKKYINKAKDDIIRDILEHYDTWDNYSLSVIYLHIFGNISRVFSLKGTLLNKWTIELSKNIHPDPRKRSKLNETHNTYIKMCKDFTDWTFMNSITLMQLKKLYEILSE